MLTEVKPALEFPAGTLDKAWNAVGQQEEETIVFISRMAPIVVDGMVDIGWWGYDRGLRFPAIIEWVGRCPFLSIDIGAVNPEMMWRPRETMALWAHATNRVQWQPR